MSFKIKKLESIKNQWVFILFHLLNEKTKKKNFNNKNKIGDLSTKTWNKMNKENIFVNEITQEVWDEMCKYEMCKQEMCKHEIYKEVDNKINILANHHRKNWFLTSKIFFNKKMRLQKFCYGKLKKID